MTGPGPVATGAADAGAATSGAATSTTGALAGVPGVVGVGVDLVDVDRFRRVLARRPGLAGRIFTDGERADAAKMSDPAERLAARFAAKEAVMKALGHGIGAFALHDVEVVRAAGPGATRGAPSLRVTAGAAELADRCGVDRWHVSLSHTAQVAMAVVVAEGRSR